MELQLQPYKSDTCGHHCVAMVTGRRAIEVIKYIGHVNGTYCSELVSAFKHFGITTDTKMRRISKNTVLPDLCILKFHFKDQKNTHWVVYECGFIYDPSIGIYCYCEYCMNLMTARATSYLTINK